MTESTTTLELSKTDQLKLEITHRIAELHPEVKRAERLYDRLKDEAKEAKADWEGLVRQLSDLCEELTDVENGNYTPSLFDQQEAKAALESAVAKLPPVDTFGMVPLCDIKATVDGKKRKFPKPMIESLEKLDPPIIQFRELEAFIAADEWWHKKIKGVGEKKVDAIIDIIVAYRAMYPIPTIEDEPDRAEDTAEQQARKVARRGEAGKEFRECWAAGEAAAMDGQSLNQCPYETGDKALHWKDGFDSIYADPPPASDQEVDDLNDTWATAIGRLDVLIGNCADVPEVGLDFASDVAAQAGEMKAWIVEHEHVTDEQLTAIGNWESGVANWLQPAGV